MQDTHLRLHDMHGTTRVPPRSGSHHALQNMSVLQIRRATVLEHRNARMSRQGPPLFISFPLTTTRTASTTLITAIISRHHSIAAVLCQANNNLKRLHDAFRT